MLQTVQPLFASRAHLPTTGRKPAASPNVPVRFGHADEYTPILNRFPHFAPPPFNAAFHRERREVFISKLPPNTSVVIVGNGEVLRNGDVNHAFRQESNFHYLTGFDEPDAVAVLSNVPGQPRFTLIVPPRDPLMETWNGKRAGTEGALKTYGADAAWDNTRLADALKQAFRNSPNVQWIPAEANSAANRQVEALFRQEKRVALAAQRLQAFFRRQKPVMQPPDASQLLYEMRLIKTPYEQALLKRACDITIKGFVDAMKTLRPQPKDPVTGEEGLNEGRIQARIEHHSRDQGAVRMGYGSIAGAGKNACVLHYVTNSEYAKDGDLVLVDIGAEYGYYTADITRTWPVNGKFTPEQKAVYDIVLKAQEAGIRMSRPGVTMEQIHSKAVEVVTEGLVDLGLLKGNVPDLIKEGAYRKYFMHGTGHMLGMDVHDVPLKSTDDNGVPLRGGAIRKRPLEPGMVFTVEPGIYIDPEVAKKEGVDPKWWGIGVRIEDDILITPDGHENLSAGLPKTTEAIERLMASSK